MAQHMENISYHRQWLAPRSYLHDMAWEQHKHKRQTPSIPKTQSFILKHSFHTIIYSFQPLVIYTHFNHSSRHSINPISQAFNVTQVYHNKQHLGSGVYLHGSIYITTYTVSSTKQQHTQNNSSYDSYS
ncbi:hypothetical protein RND81_03G026600 [Saponaria officinalis]|uniref:Uncharacterized protein n=1 Tax=Saponaria officinalis TaxID=3572 RepID=A0AAW1M0Y3_SAPOF